MTWLIIGANGQLGMALSVVLSSRRIKHASWDSNTLDIRSKENTIQKISLFSPSVVINAAAWTDVDGAELDPVRAYQVNAEGALNLALAAKSNGAVFGHISTDYVFSGTSNTPWQEKDLPSPISVYGSTKAAGEEAVLENYGEYSYIFRTAWLYSKWGKNFAKTMIGLALSGDGEVRVVNDQFGQPTAALDLANQIVDTVLAELPFGIYHATNCGEASWFDFAKEVFRLSGGVTARIVPVASIEFPRPAKRPTYSVLGHEAWQNIGKNQLRVFRMRGWMEALADMMPSMIEEVKTEKFL
jgi:dTDP-4-dehydrorhamnose reductase